MLLRLPFSKTILVFVKELVRVTAEFLGTPKKSGGGKVGKPRESARRFYHFVTEIFIRSNEPKKQPLSTEIPWCRISFLFLFLSAALQTALRGPLKSACPSLEAYNI